MYIKLNKGVIDKYPYSLNELKNENPNTSFPENITDELLAEYEVFKVNQVSQPEYDYTQYVIEESPNLINGEWHQYWSVIKKTADVINATAEELRADAYRNESDPIFFKWQRGEATEQDWLDKVAEIKARY